MLHLFPEAGKKILFEVSLRNKKASCATCISLSFRIFDTHIKCNYMFGVLTEQVGRKGLSLHPSYTFWIITQN